MRKQSRFWISLLIIATCAALAQSAPLARSADDIPPLYYPVSGPIAPPPGNAPATEQVTVMLELSPTADSAALERDLAQLGVPTLFETKLAYDGIAVSASADQITRLEKLGGVEEAHVIPPKERSNISISTVAQAQRAWYIPPGLTGTQVRIGVIDSGIDYTHATFGGAGTPQAYVANNPAIVELGSFPTPKVAGGYDFVGDSYDADGIAGSATPAPDADPLDCRAPTTTDALNRGGHGTHVAAIAAGQGVLNGQTYTGPYDSAAGLTFDLQPGVAPNATLYSFKIFGCRGSTTFLTRAIEYAIDPNGDGVYSDRLVDVLNISLGSPFGSPDDPDALAVQKAVEAGVVVVTSAGDTGNIFYSISSPASADAAIAVGAADATGNAPAPFSARGPQRGNGNSKPDLIAPGVDIFSAAAGSGSGTVAMNGTSAAAAQVSGAAALLIQRSPNWSPDLIKGALVSTATPLEAPTGVAYPSSLIGAGTLNLKQIGTVGAVAFVQNTAEEEGDLAFGAPWMTSTWSGTRTISIYNPEPVARVVALDQTTTVTETGVTLKVPSGPIELPPNEITTVPVTISVDPTRLDYTIDPFTPTQQGIFDRYYLAEHSGSIRVASTDFTRVRAAHGAAFGSVAFLIDGKPLDEQIVASQVGEYGVAAPGKHTISVVPDDADFTLPAYVTLEVELKERVDYTFALLGGGTVLYLIVFESPRIDPGAGEAFVQFANGNRVGDLDAYLDGALYVGGLRYASASELFTIPAGQHRIEFYRAGVTPGSETPVAITTINAREGHIVLVGAGERGIEADCGGDSSCRAARRAFVGVGWSVAYPPIALNIPFQIFPKSASQANAVTTNLAIGGTQTTISLGLQNSGPRNALSSPRGSQTPLVSAFELVASSPQIADLAPNNRPADIRYFGITNSYSVTTNIDNTVLYFGLASYAPWSTPNEVQFRVYIDSTGPAGVPDGIDDYALVNTSFGTIATGEPNEAFVSPLYNVLPDGTLKWTGFPVARWNSLPSPAGSPFLDPAPYNTSVMFQHVNASFIGLTAGRTTFRYHVEARTRDAGNFSRIIDRIPATGSLTYNVAATAAAPINAARGVPNLQQRPVFLDVSGQVIGSSVSPAILAARGQQDLLLLHHHNPPATQAELVTLRIAAGSELLVKQGESTFRMAMPIVVR